MSIIYRKNEKYPDSILIRDFVGKVGVNEIIESWEYLISNNKLDHKVKGVINNLSDCDLLMDMEGFRTLIAYLVTKKELQKIKLAVVCICPEQVVFPMQGEYAQNQLQIKPFSLIESAEKWIK